MVKYKEPTVIYSDYKSFVYPDHMNIGTLILDKLLNYKDKVALIDGHTNKKLVYSEMAQLIVNTASALKQIVKQGEVIAICSENRTEVLTTAIAGWAIGAVVTFINSAYGKDELIHTTNISKPAIVFLSPKTYKAFSKTFNSISFVKNVIVYGNEIIEPAVTKFVELTGKKADVSSFKTDSFDGSGHTALILYSSGTTGLPKGVKLSHYNLITAGIQPFNSLKDRVCMSIAPWSNTVGIILTMRMLMLGQTIVYLNRFHEELYLKCIETHKVGLLLTVPPLVVLLNQSKIIKQFDVRSVELIYTGGAPIDKGVMENAKKTFPNLKHLLQGYGMTEATGALTEEFEDNPRQGSVGTIVQGNIIKIVDVETRKLLGPNQPGELCVKGPVLFQGYIGKDLKDDLDEEGFYKTGDIAYYDEDGFFYIVDRMKELIKYKAGQVAPSELEGLLIHHPAVQDVAVVGAPDPLAGELPLAFVVKHSGVNVTEKEIKDYVAAKVSSWKQLRGGVRFVQEIPKTPSGKILRRKLRELLKPTSKL